jgi:hypothetical protein
VSKEGYLQKEIREARAIGFLGSGSVFSMTEASFRLATFSALTDFVSGLTVGTDVLAP